MYLMDVVFPRRRRVIGVTVMAAVAVLQIAGEFWASRDSGRFLAKLLALILGLPLLLAWGSTVFRWAAQRRVEAVPVLLIGTFFSGALFAAILSVVRVVGLSTEALRPTTGHWGSLDVLRIGFTVGMAYFALWALAFVFPFAAEDARIRALEADKLRSEAELAQLRSNFAPHFLLNTLNAIAGLVTERPREARRLLASLGDLLRDSLRVEGETQTLEEQLEWLRRYAQILEVRHAGQLVFRWDVQGETRRALLPRLLLQPLVENAVKHGALMRQGGGEVTVSAKLNGQTLVCTIEDNGPGLSNGTTRPNAFGLASVRRRLALRYANGASLRLESSPSGTRSVVELPNEQ
jgi:hypothetical protein